ncbi:MAG: acetylxylan esterase [Planctomycetales bacterium]|nr:acetylxylan esterase [Planctomycetales bacterium]
MAVKSAFPRPAGRANRQSLLLQQGVLALLLWGTTALLAAEPETPSPDWQLLQKQALALGELKQAPRYEAAAGFEAANGLEPIFYEGLPWQGRPTRVFAWLGLPPAAKNGKRVPGVVLVHGGGGTAFREWVEKWNAHGFAAISIAVEGQTDVPDPAQRWQRHPHGGPARAGIYADSDKPLAEQWMYHAVADTVLANSLLRSLPAVDAEHVGLMGISWGGVITSTVMGIDDRFAFAIPTYGCGDLSQVGNQYGRALGNNQMYQRVWDPLVRMNRVKMPVLWLSWTGDQHFPLDSLRSCYSAAPGPHMVAMVPNMRHGHGAGWNPEDSYAFADSIVRDGAPWCLQQELKLAGRDVEAQFVSAKPIDRATLVYTLDRGFTGTRDWKQAQAMFQQNRDRVTVKTALPADVTAWFLSVHSGKLVASSDYREAEAAR